MRKVSIDALFGFSGDVAARLLGFFATIHLARSLGTSAFGITVVGTSVLSYAFWLSDFGLATLGTREIAKPRAAREFQPGDILLAKLLFAAAIFLIFEGIALIGYHGDPVQPVLQLYLFSLFPYALLLEWYYQGIRNFRLVAISRILSAGVYLGGLLLLVHDAGDAILVPVVFLAGNLLTSAWLFFFRRREDNLRPPAIERTRLTGSIRRAMHIGLGGAFAQVIQSLPPVVVELFYSSKEAGVLGVALKGVFVLLMIDRVFVAVFLPLMAQVAAKPKEELQKMLDALFRLILVGTVTLCSVTTIFAGTILEIVFGQQYREGGQVLAILSWFVAATVVNSFFAYALIAIGEERRYFRSMLRGSVVSTAAILGLTYFAGLPGTAASVVIGESTVMILMYTEFRQFFKVAIAPPTLLMAAVAAVVIIPATAAGVHAVWLAPVVLLLLLGLSLTVGALRRDDLRLLVKG